MGNELLLLIDVDSTANEFVLFDVWEESIVVVAVVVLFDDVDASDEENCIIVPIVAVVVEDEEIVAIDKLLDDVIIAVVVVLDESCIEEVVVIDRVAGVVVAVTRMENAQVSAPPASTKVKLANEPALNVAFTGPDNLAVLQPRIV